MLKLERFSELSFASYNTGLGSRTNTRAVPRLGNPLRALGLGSRPHLRRWFPSDSFPSSLARQRSIWGFCRSLRNSAASFWLSQRSVAGPYERRWSSQPLRTNRRIFPSTIETAWDPSSDLVSFAVADERRDGDCWCAS